MNVIHGKTNLVEVGRDEFYTFLMTTPGLHNWTVPRGLGFTDHKGKLRGFLANKPEGIQFYLDVGVANEE